MIIFSNLGIRRYIVIETVVITENLYPLGITLESVDSVYLEGKETFGSVKVRSFGT
jgi:hypothetical protein